MPDKRSKHAFVVLALLMVNGVMVAQEQDSIRPINQFGIYRDFGFFNWDANDLDRALNTAGYPHISDGALDVVVNGGYYCWFAISRINIGISYRLLHKTVNNSNIGLTSNCNAVLTGLDFGYTVWRGEIFEVKAGVGFVQSNVTVDLYNGLHSQPQFDIIGATIPTGASTSLSRTLYLAQPSISVNALWPRSGTWRGVHIQMFGGINTGLSLSIARDSWVINGQTVENGPTITVPSRYIAFAFGVEFTVFGGGR